VSISLFGCGAVVTCGPCPEGPSLTRWTRGCASVSSPVTHYRLRMPNPETVTAVQYRWSGGSYQTAQALAPGVRRLCLWPWATTPGGQSCSATEETDGWAFSTSNALLDLRVTQGGVQTVYPIGEVSVSDGSPIIDASITTGACTLPTVSDMPGSGEVRCYQAPTYISLAANSRMEQSSGCPWLAPSGTLADTRSVTSLGSVITNPASYIRWWARRPLCLDVDLSLSHAAGSVSVSGVIKLACGECSVDLVADGQLTVPPNVVTCEASAGEQLLAEQAYDIGCAADDGRQLIVQLVASFQVTRGSTASMSSCNECSVGVNANGTRHVINNVLVVVRIR
jgi:hypothetical protein